jgi:hypothetical protein
LKKYIYLLYIFPPELHTHTYDFVVLTSLTHPRKILLGVLRIGKFENGKSQRLFLLLFLVCEAIGTAATPGLLCQHRVIVKMIVEKQMECILAGETEVLGQNLPQRHFCPS